MNDSVEKFRPYKRLICTVSLVALGIILMFFMHGVFGPIFSVKVISFLIPVPVLGFISLVSGLFILIPKWRIPAIIGGIFVTGGLTISSVISLWATPDPHSPTIALLPLTILPFVEGLYNVINDKYNNPILEKDVTSENHQISSEKRD